MQNAKDTFYELLRERLATINPVRTIVVRGVTRPGVLVDENEMQASAALPDCFHLQWTAETIDDQGAMPLAAMSCQVVYATAGASMNAGLDRGRALAAMDAELLTAVRQEPWNAPKKSYSGVASGGSATLLSTRVWWSEVSFSSAKVDRDRMTRTATIVVMSYEEKGER